MPVRKHNAPPGLDYDPITGEEQNISYGVVGASIRPTGRLSARSGTIRQRSGGMSCCRGGRPMNFAIPSECARPFTSTTMEPSSTLQP
jgi:hypothetical protein